MEHPFSNHFRKDEIQKFFIGIEKCATQKPRRLPKTAKKCGTYKSYYMRVYHLRVGMQTFLDLPHQSIEYNILHYLDLNRSTSDALSRCDMHTRF